MKVIDEKGRLFGKINVIDLMIIVLIVAVFLGVGYKLFLQDNNSVNDSAKVSKEAEVTFCLKTIAPGTEEALAVGDKLIANDVVTDAEIIDVQISDSQAANPDENGKVVISSNPLYKKAVVTVKMSVEVTEGGVSFMGESIKANDTFDFETAAFIGKADIIKIVCE